MSDTQVSVTFGGSTGEFEAATQRALAAMQALTAGVAGLTSGLAATTQGLNAATPAMAAVASTATRASASLNQVASSSKVTTAEVQATVNAFAGMTRETKSAADSADVFRAALGDQTNEVKALRASMDETTAAAGRTGHASGGITRELIVLGHEAMMGNFSRFGGSLIVMAELMGNVSIATVAAGGALALAGVGAYHLYENFKLATQQAQSLNAQMALMGRDPEQVAASATLLQLRLRQTGDVGRTAARDIADQFMRLNGTTDDLRTRLGALVPALHATDATKSVDEWAGSLAKTASSAERIKTFLQENNLFANVAQREQIEGYITANDLAGAQELLIERVNARWGDQYKAITEAKKAADGAAKDAIAKGSAFLQAVPPGQAKPEIPKPKMTEAAEDPGEQRVDQAIVEGNAQRREQLQLEDEIQGMRQRLLSTTDEEGRHEIETAIAAKEARHAQLIQLGDTSWLPKQEEALSAEATAIKQSAATSKEATAAILVNEKQHWEQLLAGDELNGAQREAAQHQLSRVEGQIADAALRDKDAKAAAATATARKSTQEQLAELSAQQAANREDFTKWMALEQEKLGILRAAYGEKSKQFQDELRAEETYQREHIARLQALELQRVTQTNALGEKSLSQKVSRLGTEVAQQLRTTAEELEAEKALTEAERVEEVKRLALFIGTQTQGTQEFEKSRERMLALEANFATKMAAIDKKIADEQAREARRGEQSYNQMFSQIGSIGERTATGLVMHTETWQRATQQLMSTVLGGFISMTAHEMATWAAKEFANSAISTTQTKARIARDQEAGNSGLSAILMQAAHWAAMQLGMTSATEAGDTSRQATDAAAATATAAKAAAAGLAQISVDSKVAGAGAYAFAAPAGPAAATAAAAAAMAETMGFGASLAVPSFDVGAWNLPSNMLAMVHAGEMIIPAGPAGALRSAVSSGSGGGGSGAPDVHLHLHANDVSGAQAYFNTHGLTLARVLQQVWRTQPTLRPAS